MTPSEKVEVLRASCCVAGADSNTDDAENTLLTKLAKEIGVGKASLEAMIERAENDPDFHQQQFQILKSDPAPTVAILIEVAVADGVLSEREITVLRNLATNLGIQPEVMDQLLKAAHDSVNQ